MTRAKREVDPHTSHSYTTVRVLRPSTLLHVVVSDWPGCRTCFECHLHMTSVHFECFGPVAAMFLVLLLLVVIKEAELPVVVYMASGLRLAWPGSPSPKASQGAGLSVECECCLAADDMPGEVPALREGLMQRVDDSSVLVGGVLVLMRGQQMDSSSGGAPG